MKIYKRKEICLKCAKILVVLVVCNRIVFSSEVQHCKATNDDGCIVMCRDWDLDSQTGVGGFQEILQEEGKKYETCGLIFVHCNLKTRTINHWESLNPDTELKISNLSIIHSSIDISKLDLEILRNIQQLTMRNTTVTTLQRELYLKLPNLRRLQLQGNKFLQKVDEGFLRNLSLEYLVIQGVELNQKETLQMFQNLTGEHEVPSIRELDWSYNNFGNFPKSLLAPFTNLKVLILTNCNISGFEDEVFNHKNLKRVYVDGNKIQNLPERIFRPLVKKGVWLSLRGNPLICDEDMEWINRVNVQSDCVIPERRFLEVDACSENAESSVRYTSGIKSLQNKSAKSFTITNDDPDCLEIQFSGTVNLEGAFLWYGNYENATYPYFKCLKILHRKLKIDVKPNVNYIICLSVVEKNFQMDITDCLPIKTSPHHEDQPWLLKKSIPISIISIFVVFLLALATGAVILYLSVRKNPSLIRGSKRVIEVKRHDKAQILIMPRGYESVSQESSPLAIPTSSFSLEPSSSYDTISTVSYVSANQPTPLEILSYRFTRLRELFQRSSVPSFLLSNQMLTPVNRRLPPNVDLLLEYEWYTITTTTTTQV